MNNTSSVLTIDSVTLTAVTGGKALLSPGEGDPNAKPGVNANVNVNLDVNKLANTVAKSVQRVAGCSLADWGDPRAVGRCLLTGQP